MKRSRFITVLLLVIASLVMLIAVETAWTVESYREMRRHYTQQIETIFNEASHLYINDLYTRSGVFSLGKIERFRSIIDEELRRAGLTPPFSIEVIVTATDEEIILMSSYTEDLGQKPIVADIAINIITLRLKVKDPHQDILGSMISNILLQATSVLVLILAFCYLLTMIFRAKEVDRIRRDLTDNITHELKTPIAAAYAATEALRTIPSIAEDATSRNDYLDMSLGELKRLSTMVEEILRNSTEEFSTAELRLEECNIGEMVGRIRSSLDLKYPARQVDWRVDIEPACCVVADMFHIEGALSAILDNAIKYSGDRAMVRVSATTERGYTRIDIEDNGKGIPHKERHNIFKKFYRIGSGNGYNTSGYGIGLYYARSVVKRHGGEISFHSVVNRGTTFTLKLPRYGK